ncbi:hypothetical protein G7Y89_g9059 [Cudoniella acicularis]|uniref:CPAF-like PDZ domain-containing protein n=1 Tax=Cudoniella acicularis TaxID=354080 RepID=A0A8H4RGY0_9HELO|nr:hypothetical protein G7Y89_g9059 [Cudoniella acicularis]
MIAAVAAVEDVVGLPGSLNKPNSCPSGSAPCAVVSSSASAQLATARAAQATIDAQLAFDCLNSVSLRVKEAMDLVDTVRSYIEWQSDSAYLKDPPADYPFPPADILGALDAVRTNVMTGTYKNEYQFQAALFQTFNQAHDGHFAFYSDALTKAFIFRRQVALVSVSNDGIEIPKIYVYNAGYNAMFFSKASLAGIGTTGFFQIGGPFGFIWPGAKTTLQFENGTTTTYRNQAAVRGNFTGVTDGDSFYQKFCTGPTPTSSLVPTSSTATISSTTSTSATPKATAIPDYPAPAIVNSDAVISGYYLTEPGIQDVAVLSVLDFLPKSPAEFKCFPNFDAKFGAAKDKTDSFTKLIRLNIDDPLITSNTTYGIGIDITGYGNRKNFTQPFAAEDIILVYDGFCASTCTIFSEFMRLQTNVKGVQSYSMALIYGDAQRAL